MKLKIKIYKQIFFFVFLLLGLSGCTISLQEEQSQNEEATNSQQPTLVVDSCDLSGKREANAIVDVGYGDRIYLAKTNENKQLVEVTAKEIILQTEKNLYKGRYCKDEAKVAGTEKKNLDEGHVIADSLGGVSNAYNITPQDSTQNRQGTQADFEEQIRTALENKKSVTDFQAVISYPNSKTMIPNSYEIKFKINSREYTYSFDNQ
ncbi:MAG: DNA/RNA non-specific endonuclease [Mycoplasmatales bacterium]